jgi:aspartate carbamoyltransferase catalytic subunit
MKPDTVVMHPGPMIRGPEIATEVVDGPRSLVREQVTNGWRCGWRCSVAHRLGRPVA